jgi:hypothetical protein
MRTISFAAALLAALALAGCGGEDEPAADAGPLTIEEALEAEPGERVRVTGNLLVAGGETRLCSALAESFPPQCGGPSLAVAGLAPETVAGIVVEGDVMWTDRPVELEGSIRDGTLEVAASADR